MENGIYKEIAELKEKAKNYALKASEIKGSERAVGTLFHTLHISWQRHNKTHNTY
jgi:hypothetical protein